MRIISGVLKATAWVVFIAFVAFVGFVTYLISTSMEDDTARRNDVAKVHAVCMTAVTDTLRDPRSVQWDNQMRWPVEFDESGDVVRVGMAYRAANGFGGIVPASSICTARRAGNWWTARIEG